MKIKSRLCIALNRMKQDNFKLYLVSISSWGSRVVSAFCQLFILKLLLINLGVQQYSVFALVISLASWFMIMDFGFSQMIHNHIGAHGYENSEKYLWGGFYYVAFFQLIVICCIFIFGQFISTFVFSGFSFIDDIYKLNLLKIAALILCFNTISNYFIKVLYAKGLGLVANCLSSLGSITGAALIYFVFLKVKATLVVSILFYFSPTIVFIIGYFLYRGVKFHYIQVSRSQLNIAVGFFFISLMSVLTLQIDYLLLSHYVDNKDCVVIYNIITKLFSFVFFICYSVLLAIWPSFNRMSINKEYKKMKTFCYKFLVCGAGLILTFTVMLCWGKSIVADVFLDKIEAKKIETLFIVLVGMYNIVMLYVSVYSVMLQSANLLRVFYIAAPLQAFFGLLMQYYFVKLWGINGIVFALIMSYILVPVIMLPREFYKHERGLI